MSVNVNRSVSDQFYRYMMPCLIANVEGRGNGIKTDIVNMVDFAKVLDQPPKYLTKYSGYTPPALCEAIARNRSSGYQKEECLVSLQAHHWLSQNNSNKLRLRRSRSQTLILQPPGQSWIRLHKLRVMNNLSNNAVTFLVIPEEAKL
ncbi:Eukaryotic translation initiation factor 5 [Fukomys damarensis]|uniref:Eukaryotic translation initiation factor 5 n=1 Tax=Fukomys damarensis TaxID=885580 RepID=A0A091CNX1_FUKDA|nr:Eukaryotic translation initiation factor 5 [Fukomys damarensis]